MAFRGTRGLFVIHPVAASRGHGGQSGLNARPDLGMADNLTGCRCPRRVPTPSLPNPVPPEILYLAEDPAQTKQPTANHQKAQEEFNRHWLML